MKITKYILISIFAFTLLSACKKDEVVTTNEASIIPETFMDRPVDVQENIYLGSRNVTISAWDSETIDGDIISLYVNGEKVIDNFELKGPTAKKTVNITLKYNGFNYILLYAHNEGTMYPNTAKLSINDGISNQELILSASMTANAAADLIVDVQ